MPSISVVIPLYNKGLHIARAVDSVLNQTVIDFEIVIVDDGSTDNGAEIVATYQGDRIRLIRQENQGVSAARNRGINEARSDFIAFLDADDEWEPDHLETLLRLRSKFPEAGAYATAYVQVLPGEKIVLPKFQSIPPAPWEGIIPDYFKAAALGAPPVCSSAVGIRKEVFKKIGFFNEKERVGEDLDLWGRVAIVNEIAFSWEGLAIYWRDNNTTIARFMDKDLPFIQSAEEYYLNKRMPYYLKKYLSVLKLTYVFYLADSGERLKASKRLFLINFFTSRQSLFLKALCKIILPRKSKKIIKFVREWHSIDHKTKNFGAK